MKKITAFLLIIATITALSVGFYSFYLIHMSKQLIENWLRIEQVSIQQGNIFSSLATSNRMLLSSGMIKSVMLFDVQNESVSEMASYGEYMSLENIPSLRPGELESKLSGVHDVTTFVKFQERPNLVAVFKTTSPESGYLFIFMLGLLILIIIGFAMYIQKLARVEEANRFSIIESAMEDLLQEVPPRDFVVNQMPHILEQWSSIRTGFERLKEKLENSARDRVMVRTSQMLGHDLRAPLGTFEKLLYTPDHEIPSMKGAIRDALNRLYSMVESLRYSEAETIVQRQPSNLDFTFGRETLQAKAEQRGIKLNVVQSCLNPVSIDVSKFERAWINLASNALEFAHSEVKVDAKAEGADLIVRVMDDGPGVQEGLLPRLFQRGATGGKLGGTGLGLAYAKQIIQGHGGSISYQRENGWTVFECRLPNALIAENQSTPLVEPVASIKGEPQIVKVAVCCEPSSVADEWLSYLTAIPRGNYLFTQDMNDASIVISNRFDLILKALEAGKKTIDIASLSDEKIKRRLDIRFPRFES